MTKVYFLLVLILGINACTMKESSDQSSATEASPSTLLMIGTYTQKLGHVDGKAAGIYTLAPAGDSLFARAHTTTGIENPSYLTIDTAERLLYAASELVPGGTDSSGYIYSYKIGPEGGLTYLNRQPSYGFAPCYVSISNDGQFVMAANYVGGTVAVYPRKEDGSLGEATDQQTFTGSGPHEQQEASHPHCIMQAPKGPWVYIADKGTDRVMSFRLTAKGLLQPTEQQFVQTAPGAGPRHLAFHPTLPVAYLINEINNTVDVFQMEKTTGALSSIQTLTTLPEGFTDFSACADIHVSPDGRHLYASNRGHNSLAIYRIQAESGQLESLGWVPTKGDFPRNFMITEDGSQVLVANQNSDNIVIFDRNPASGQLTQQGAISCPTPVCIKSVEL
jgi:6-phosphogluconolactonase